MVKQEKKIQLLDISMIIGLFFAACFFGKISMDYFGDTWIAFNGPALGILVVGGVIWWAIRRFIIKKWDEK